MSQSSWIVTALAGGFIGWLLLNGKLRTYWDLLSAQAPPAGSAAAAASSPASAPSGGLFSGVIGALDAVKGVLSAGGSAAGDVLGAASQVGASAALLGG